MIQIMETKTGRRTYFLHDPQKLVFIIWYSWVAVLLATLAYDLLR